MDDEQVSESARLRAAQYARQPSLWAAPNPPPTTRPNPWRPAQVVRTAVTAAVLLVGPPWLLWTAFGNPVTVWSAWWSTGPFTAATSGSPAAGLRVALIWAGWLAWAVLATLLVGSVAGVLRGRRLPWWRLPMPLHRLVFGLTGTATVALVASPATAAAAPAAHATPFSLDQQGTSAKRLDVAVDAAAPAPLDATAPAEAQTGNQRVIVAVGDVRYEHPVRSGDTMSKIAKIWLDDPDRWPDICRLNKHRHFADGRTLTDCDLIYPKWQLRLPADAVPPPTTKPIRPSRTPNRPTAPPERAQPQQTNPPVADPVSPRADPDRSPETAPVEDSDSAHDRSGDDLVLPGGSIIPWTLAVAITATAALVWLQRRRRYVPGVGNDHLGGLPAPVLAAQHHTRHAITPPPAPAPDEAPHFPGLPAGGLGLIGSGADAAARGLLITALTAGTPTEPAQRAEVIIDQHTLTTLIGDTPITGWTRLHITATLDQALTLLDTHLLRRARILDEHSLTDIDTLRDTAPSEEALPPLLLIALAEHATVSTRARITFGLTEGLDITTVVLGHWPHGPSVSVSDDGVARFGPGGPDSALRLAVLDIPTTRELLTTAREAHTGAAAPASESTTPGVADEADTLGSATAPLQTSRVDGTDAGTTTPAGTARKRARLRVLGTPRIEDITADGRPLRAKALELAVYLAVHPDGASTREIGEYLEPDARLSQADQRVHTNASNLRHVLGRAATPGARNAYLIKTAGRYRLDPDTVDVDVWTLRDLLRAATLASGPRRRDLLTAACALSTAPLADGHDYEWIPAHRETVRRWGTEAHLLLAEDLLSTDPQTASDLLGKAITLDRYNEALYTTAMHARHALGDADGIRTLLRALTKALADLDAEPHDDTIALADQLRTRLNKQ